MAGGIAPPVAECRNIYEPAEEYRIGGRSGSIESDVARPESEVPLHDRRRSAAGPHQHGDTYVAILPLPTCGFVNSAAGEGRPPDR